MSAENVVFLAVGVVRGHDAALGGSQNAMMQERFFPEGARVPADHAGGGHGHPVDTAGFARNISANFLEALSPKDLALPGDVGLSFETVSRGIVSVGLGEHGAGNAQPIVLAELGEQKLEMIGVE